MPKIFTSKSQRIGELGENIACNYLKSNGFVILERNFTRRLGEIDIVAEKGKRLFFIEVKSVSYETLGIRPEENVHEKKLQKIYRTIEVYLEEKHVSEAIEWQLDLVCVYLDNVHKKAKVKHLSNIVG